MKPEVANAIEDLKRQFSSCVVNVRDDAHGGAFVLIDGIGLGARYIPATTWMGFHIPAQYPYADIYPAFIGAEVRRVDGVGFTPPVTPGQQFEQRAAIQVSRRNSTAQNGLQKASAKVLKILDFLERLP